MIDEIVKNKGFAWRSNNIFKNIESERFEFLMNGGEPSPEEWFRFVSLGVKLTLKQFDVDLWLDSDVHVNSPKDLKKVQTLVFGH